MQSFKIVDNFTKDLTFIGILADSREEFVLNHIVIVRVKQSNFPLLT